MNGPNYQPTVKTRVLVLDISSDDCPSTANKLVFSELEGHDELTKHLTSAPTVANQSRLFIVENIFMQA